MPRHYPVATVPPRAPPYQLSPPNTSYYPYRYTSRTALPTMTVTGHRIHTPLTATHSTLYRYRQHLGHAPYMTYPIPRHLSMSTTTTYTLLVHDSHPNYAHIPLYATTCATHTPFHRYTSTPLTKLLRTLHTT